MSDRGPDSAGIAIYQAQPGNTQKLTLQSANPQSDFDVLEERLSQSGSPAGTVRRIATHAVISASSEDAPALRELVTQEFPQLRVMSQGSRIEIFKETGLPGTVAESFEVPAMHGSHGIGHTRMATESAVTTMGAHPFSTGADQCLVHNLSLIHI